MIGYLDKVMRPLLLILPYISGYVKTFNVKDGNKDRNNTFMSFCTDNDKLLENYETIWTKIEDLKIEDLKDLEDLKDWRLELNAFPIYDDWCIKTKIIIYGDKVYTNFCGVNMPEYGAEYESFAIHENKYCLWKHVLPTSKFIQLCWWNCRQANDRLIW